MIGTTLAICLPGADARTIRRAGMAAEKYGLTQLWAGDPRGAAANSDDNYVLAALAATAAMTRYVRLGAFLRLAPTTQIMRIAEDVAIVDAVSNGRIEVGLISPSAVDASWEERAAALLGAYHEWPGANGEIYSVTPGLQQSWLPRLISGGSDEQASRLGAGRAVWPEDAKPAASRVARSVSLCVEFKLGIRSAIAHDPAASIVRLRSLVHAAGAHQLITVLPVESDPEPDIHALGAVVSPGIRATAQECEQLARDAWTWVNERRQLHESPYERHDS